MGNISTASFATIPLSAYYRKIRSHTTAAADHPRHVRLIPRDRRGLLTAVLGSVVETRSPVEAVTVLLLRGARPPGGGGPSLVVVA